MKAIIDASLAFSFGVPLLECIAQCSTEGLIREVDVRRCAAKCGCPMASEEVVGGDSPAQIQFEVCVHIDAAWHDKHARGIHHLSSASVQVLANLLDRFAVDQDVGPPFIYRSNYRAVRDQRAHSSFSQKM